MGNSGPPPSATASILAYARAPAHELTWALVRTNDRRCEAPTCNPSRCRCRETQGPLFALADLNEDVPTRRYWWGETDILRGQEIERLDRLLQVSHERPQPFQTPSPPFPFHRLDSQLSLIVLSFAGALRRLVESVPSLPGSLLVPAVIDRQRVAKDFAGSNLAPRRLFDQRLLSPTPYP